MVSLKESLSKINQTEEICFSLEFWSNEEQMVTKYLGLSFLEHNTIINLFVIFQEKLVNLLM